MPTTVDDVTAKTEMLEMEKEKLNGKEQKVDHKEKEEMNVSELSEEKAESKQVEEEKTEETNPEAKRKEILVEVEPKTGVSFLVELDDGKQLKTVGLRKKSVLGLGIKIYSFGVYAENQKLKDLLRSKIEKAPAKPTKDMYQMVIDSDVGTVVKLIIVFSNLTMSMVRKNFDEGLGAAIKKLTGGKNDELTKK